MTLRWSTENTRGHARQDPEQTVNVRIPCCPPCRIDHERDARPRLRRAVDLLSACSVVLGISVWFYDSSLVWQFNVALIGIGLLGPFVARALLKRTGKGRALEVAKVKGNFVEIEGPSTFRAVLTDEAHTALVD